MGSTLKPMVCVHVRVCMCWPRRARVSHRKFSGVVGWGWVV